MKYLIVSGCSFTTDIDFRSTEYPDMDTSWPKWPQLLAEKLNMKCINLARSGMGNEYIYSTLHDQILSIPNKDEIGLVIAAWSQCQRSDYQKITPWLKNPNNITASWVPTILDTQGDVLYWVRRSLRYFLAFENMCERYNIPYLQTQMLGLFNDYLEGRIFGQDSYEFPTEEAIHGKSEVLARFRREKQEILEILMKYDEILNTSKFIGWPNAHDLATLPLNHMVFGLENYKHEPWTISKSDLHPNADGHKKIAEYIYDTM